MKKIFLISLCCFILLFAGCDDEADNSTAKESAGISFEGYNGDSDAVMTINGESVSVDEFNYFLIMASFDLKSANDVDDANLDTFWSETEPESGKTYASLAIEDAIDRCTAFHVYRTEAIRRGINLTDEDKQKIENQSNYMKDSYGEEMNILQLKAGGLTPEVHLDITEMSYYSNKLFSNFVGEFRKITDEEISDFYYDNYVRAKHILVMTVNPETGEQLSEQEKTAALEEISEVYSRLQAGEDFDELMIEYTDDTGYQLKPDGYTFTMDDEYTQAFKETAFSIAEGSVSDIVQSEYGYHIVKREPLKEDYPATNYEPIQENIYRSEFQKMLDECEKNAVIIGNKPVFNNIDVGKVLGDYLAIQEETLELIKQEFMKINGDAE